MEYKEGDLVLCTVEKVESTVCFVHLPDGSKGTIISSEIAPGRIKFMRAYVVPNKKIVCKILRISNNNLDLSLRRVNAKEKKQVLQEFKQQLANKAALKQVLKDDYESVKEKILNDFNDLLEFIIQAREKTELINNYIPEKYHGHLQKIIQKKKKQVELKYIITIKFFGEDGVKKIKDFFSLKDYNITITYLSAGKYLLRLKVPDFKEGKHLMQEILEILEKRAKEYGSEMEYKEEKQ